MRKLLPLLLAILGTGAGVGTALILKSPHDAETAEVAAGDCVPGDEHGATAAADTSHDTPAHGGSDGHGDAGFDYVKMSNQFVVPIVRSDRVTAQVVLSLSVEAPSGRKEDIYLREPKLRDVFLQVLFDHANAGGFDGNFTDVNRLQALRAALLEAAKPVMGRDVQDVLITEIARQDSA